MVEPTGSIQLAAIQTVPGKDIYAWLFMFLFFLTSTNLLKKSIQIILALKIFVHLEIEMLDNQLGYKVWK